ncbi:MAG: 2-amino-4-hydroxy-6-hydroxymethyldihydropteridine diphosphokinase [Gammaproteobacteria bacterium]|jgi:2-amino-4-hydroxy-6-hydroxymethyldihydropteridine diphosphokinase|tara:strand:+ start:375 stop:869 length:495 start_codon:yes stop_codon:yes gene_type:complete
MSSLHLNIGSNQDKRKNIRLALDSLEPHFTKITTSSLYESPSEGFIGGNFYNIGVNVETDKNINEVVNILHGIENSLGRDRNLPKFSSRIIDLDLVLYDDDIDDKLNIPRRDILKYAFVLAPLAELNPNDIHPQERVSYLALWKGFQSSKEFELNQYNIDKLFD